MSCGGGVCKAVKWDCDCALQNCLCHRTQDFCTFWEKYGVILIICICAFVFCVIPIACYVYKRRKLWLCVQCFHEICEILKLTNANFLYIQEKLDKYASFLFD